MRYLTRAHVVGVGVTKLGKLGKSAFQLTQEAFESALADAGVKLSDVDGVLAVPSLAEPRFMAAHSFATKIGLLGRSEHEVVCKTLDTGGASPISALLEADRMIRTVGCDLVAIVAGDAVSSMPTQAFLEKADFSCANPDEKSVSPVSPNGYDRVARWHMGAYGVTREQLAMVSVLMSRNAVKHPLALTRKPHTLEQVLSSKPIAPVTSLLECARRADGGAAVVVASSRFMKENGLSKKRSPVVISGGEASGPLYPPPIIDENMFSCEQATRAAYEGAQIAVDDVSYFSLYDCYPITLLRAVEAVGLAQRGAGGKWIQDRYEESEKAGGATNPRAFPVNTWGGLLGFGAPWEVPSMYGLIEAVEQLRGTVAPERQVPNCRRALVYGNGGIFSSSAVAILGTGER